MSAAEIVANALGGKPTAEGYLCHCPVPGHGAGRGDRRPSLRVAQGDRADLLVYCHAGCDPCDVLAELRRQGLVEEQVDERRRPGVDAGAADMLRRDAARREQDRATRQARKAAYMWGRRKPLEGSICETYLRLARGCGGPLPATLGFLSPSKPDHHPALIAAFGIPDEPEPGALDVEAIDVRSVHLTLLKPDGLGKAQTAPNKLIIGSPCGLPIVLAPPNHGLGLAITEGIEDALSIHGATGLGAWAAGCAMMMPKLADAVPDYIDCVTVIGDPDPAGRKGAAELTQRLDARGLHAEQLAGLP